MESSWRGLIFLALTSVACADLWDNSTTVEGGWKSSDWLGLYYSEDSGQGWIYHQDMGWLFTKGSAENSIWFYWPEQGWFWSGSSIFPLVWGEQHNGWYYYLNANSSGLGSPWFYNFNSGNWADRILFRPDSMDGETLVIETSSNSGHIEASYSFGSSTYTATLKRAQLGMVIPIEISGTYSFEVDPDDPETLTLSLTIDAYKITMSSESGEQTIEGTAEEVGAATGLPVTTAATVSLTANGAGTGNYEVNWTYTNGLSDQETGNISW